MEKQYIYGIHAVLAKLDKAPKKIATIFMSGSPQSKRLQLVNDNAIQNNIPVKTITRDELNQLVGEKHQGVVAEVNIQHHEEPVDLFSYIEQAEKPLLLLVLDGVQDPHNLGACLRSMAAANATAVIIPQRNAVNVNATVRKVACGAAEYIPVFQVTNLARCLQQLKQENIWIVGLTATTDQLIYDVDLTDSIALVLGAEGSGLRQLTEKHCDYLASIPMSMQSVSSLNVSVAAGISLFEVVRQRLKPN